MNIYFWVYQIIKDISTTNTFTYKQTEARPYAS